MAEVRVVGAGRHDEVVVGERLTAVERHALRGDVDRLGLAEQDAHVLLASQNPADRRCDVARRQPGSGDLIQQRLKDVMVVTIDQRHLYRRVLEGARTEEPAEPAADDDHVRRSHGASNGTLTSCVTEPPTTSTSPPPAPSTVQDACSLTVSVRDGRIVELDGGHASDVTRGYICAKVRRFPERMYGPDRVRYPMVRTGRKGSGAFSRVSWDEALEKIRV
jgi:hypothetical protein